jgi:hypothetical protein
MQTTGKMLQTRRLPNEADRAAGEAFVAETYDADPAICRTWLANHRADLVRWAAVAAMQKRQDAEFKAVAEAVRAVGDRRDAA